MDVHLIFSLAARRESLTNPTVRARSATRSTPKPPVDVPIYYRPPEAPTGPLIRGYGGSKLLQHNALQGRRVDRGVHDRSESTGCHLYRAGQRSQAAHCCRCTLRDREGDADLHQGGAIVAVDPRWPAAKTGDDRNSVEPGCARCTRPF